MDYEIREMQLEHFPAVLDILKKRGLWAKWFTETKFQQTLKMKNGFYLVAVRDERVLSVVFCDFFVLRSQGFIYKYATHPEYEGRGIGGTLINEIIRRAQAAGLRKLSAVVKKSNARSQASFRSRNFKDKKPLGEEEERLVLRLPG
ncbi:MAG: GNAT family N-acetyltransferase [Candidatus Pacebacteria bacterium]|nr:GNAT family N-acetyltransferase [Candidatus Paceibacterota bacterium]MDD5356847.1 GNAT family N-acetyltransferase [Candidatus Paceibacterota bacterium]